MKIVKDNCYEDMAATYQCLEIGRLNEILKEQGIEDRALREKICQQYFFNQGVFLDMGWFVSEGKKVYPQVHFAEKTLDPEHGLGEPETVYVTSDYFSFHEYAFGDCTWYFDEHDESIEEIELGCV